MVRMEVPTIDMQKGEGLGQEIAKAFEDWGCFRMVNHGVPPELLSEMKAVVAALFDLPDEPNTPTTYTKYGMGYLKPGVITPFYESLSINDISSPDDIGDRLRVSDHQRETVYKYVKAIREVAGVLGRKVMEVSGLGGDDLFEGWLYEVRMNKYHYSAESVGLLGSSLHSDPSFLTILVDDENVNGLEVVDKVSGEFVPIDHVPGTLVVNVGDIGKIWSNGRYYNVTHRVRCVEPKIRSSIAFFMLRPTGNKIEAPSEFIDDDHPRLYIPIDYMEFRQIRISKGAITGGAPDLFKSTSRGEVMLST